MEDEKGATYAALESKLRDKDAEPENLPLSFFEIITKNFSDEHIIGEGGFGVVYKGVLHHGEVAVKKLRDPLIEDKSFVEEIECLMRTKHRNIVRLLGYCADTQGIMKENNEGKYVLADVRVRLICFEYISNGSLHRQLKDTHCGLEWNERYRIIKGLCQGLHYLHEEKKIVHLDLKPDNILLDQEMVPKITDFGLSRLFDKQQSQIITKNCRGSRGYVAPEYLEYGLISFKSDIYSLGVIILEILTGKKERCVVQNVVENWKNRLQATLSQLLQEACHQVKTCAEIALNCVQHNRQNRPDIVSIITRLNETETDSHEQEISTSFRPDIVSIITGLNEKETDSHEQEISTSFNLLEIRSLELRFPLELNRLATSPLYLTNSTDDRIAFRLRPQNPERYFTEWLCGVVEPRSTYTLTVTMKEQKQHPPVDKDEFLIQQSRIMDGDQLKDIKQGEADAEFDNFFEEVKGIGVDLVHEKTLIALCNPQAETTSEVISTETFDKMVSMDVHPTEPWIVTGHFNGHVCMWNYETKEMVNSFELTREQEVLTVKFLAQKQWIVAGGGDCRIYVYSYNTMKRVKSFMALSNQITSLAIHPTEPYVLAASYDHVIKMWDWENGWKSTQKFKDAHSSSVMQIAFSPNDFKAFASVSMDNTVKIWSVDSSHANFTLAGHTSHVRCLDYFTRGDRQYLITGSDDRTAKIWDLQKKICVGTLEGHANRVSAVCSHPELPILMTGSRDGTVRLWDSNSFRIHMGWLMAVTLLMFFILPVLRAYSTLVSEKSMP